MPAPRSHHFRVARLLRGLLRIRPCRWPLRTGAAENAPTHRHPRHGTDPLARMAPRIPTATIDPTHRLRQRDTARRARTGPLARLGPQARTGPLARLGPQARRALQQGGRTAATVPRPRHHRRTPIARVARREAVRRPRMGRGVRHTGPRHPRQLTLRATRRRAGVHVHLVQGAPRTIAGAKLTG